MTAGERRRKLGNKARRDSKKVQNLGLGQKKPNKCLCQIEGAGVKEQQGVKIESCVIQCATNVQERGTEGVCEICLSAGS